MVKLGVMPPAPVAPAADLNLVARSYRTDPDHWRKRCIALEAEIERLGVLNAVLLTQRGKGPSLWQRLKGLFARKPKEPSALLSWENEGYTFVRRGSEIYARKTADFINIQTLYTRDDWVQVSTGKKMNDAYGLIIVESLRKTHNDAELLARAEKLQKLAQLPAPEGTEA